MLLFLNLFHFACLSGIISKHQSHTTKVKGKERTDPAGAAPSTLLCCRADGALAVPSFHPYCFLK